MSDQLPEPQMRHFLAALYATRIERALELASNGAWRAGVWLQSLSEAIDDLRRELQRRRAAQNRHLAGRRR